MTNLIGQSIGRYQILDQQGEGGMAVVYKAYDTRLEREVAVKIIRRGAFPPDQLENILKRFDREAKALARLSHPNIVKVLDYGEHEDSPFLVLEYLPGGSLKHKLGKPMEWKEVVRMLLPIAHALEFAHQEGMVHRDVKPSNILITQSGDPMLTDFGIAKLFDVEGTSELTASGVGVGTPEYMAPEQFRGSVDVRADVYGLSVIFYEMVTGRRPYQADTPVAVAIQQAGEPLPPPRQFAPDLPEDVERILLKGLAKDPNDRYQDMSAFIVAMENLMAGKAGHQAAAVERSEVNSRSAIIAKGSSNEKNKVPAARSKAPKWDTMAIISLVVGILSLLLACLSFIF